MDINTYLSELPSVSSASFDEYAELMRLYILTAKKSDSFEGTRRLLTELYPDNAHFIYELLQNAEDAEATSVRFEVYSDRLVFRHNGKRIFTLADVKGITNIGNSTKKDDHTKVGKFGVGFKSVFAFTDRPRVYSKDYSFEIQDMLLPVRIESDKDLSQEETLFVFPFKGDNQEKKKYLDQIEKELLLLDSNTIMFLDSIESISYVLSNQVDGYIRKKLEKEKIYKIDVSANKEESHWLIFEKNIMPGIQKGKLHVNVSFGLKKVDNSWRVVPVKGSVNIFFPAVMEKSGLRFNINGPFASTVARDSIRKCDENAEIYGKIAELLVEALSFIKKAGMMDISLYETMPNNEDELEGEYSKIREYILAAFNDNSFLLGAGGGYYKATEVVMTSPSIQDLFRFSEISPMVGLDEKDWCCLIPLRNKACRAFLDSLNIRSFTYRTFSKLFDEDNRVKFEDIIKGRGLSWYRNLYILLIDLKNYYQEGKLVLQYPAVIENIKNTRILLTDTDEMKRPMDVYIGNPDSIGIVEKLVNRRLLGYPELESFWKIVGITEYDERANINEELKYLENAKDISEDYFTHLLKLINISNADSIEEIYSRKIWFTNNSNVKYSIKEMYIDKPFLDTGYSAIASVIDEFHELDYRYYDRFKDDYKDDFNKFVINIGIVSGLEITKADVRRNPLYHEVLYKYSDNVTALSTSEDYTISGLDELLKSKNITISKMIWNYVISVQSLPRYCKASFSPNRTTVPRKCDSTLIQLLRENEWIPNKRDNLFYRPADISREQLPDGFEWDDGALILTLINFGLDKNKIKIQSEKLINDWGVDSSSDQAQALRALLSNPQMASQILNLVKNESENKYNLDEAISAQTRTYVATDDESDDDYSAVNNTRRRTKKIEEELEAGLKKPVSIRKLGLVARTIPSNEERVFLDGQYHGKCQICGRTIQKWNGGHYFEGINLIDTRRLDDSLKKSLEIGWNSLCLCPNHVAEYKYGAVDLSAIEEEIQGTEIIEGDNKEIPLRIVMQGETVDLMYSPKHFLALKTAFSFFREMEQK